MTLMTDTDIALRPARPEDLPAIEELIALSGRELSRDYYSARASVHAAPPAVRPSIPRTS